MKKKLNNYLENIINIAEKYQLILEEEKEIPYGISIKFSEGSASISLKIYYSKKKGISTVISSSQNNQLLPKMKKILAENSMNHNPKFHSWKRWIGSDESGKGDFFGPLVVCAFFCTNMMESYLREIGATDSKNLKDKQISIIAEKIIAKYPRNFKVLILNPKKYNEVYLKFRDQNKKLNELMAWMHSRMILDLRKNFEVDGILIDKFTSDYVIKSAIKDMKKENIMLRTKAESDIAVASASIIARYYFVKRMAELEEKFNLKLSKGASNIVIDQSREFIKKYSKEQMNEIAKLHFKTYQKV